MSTNTPGAGFGVTAEDIRACDWQAALKAASRRECDSYSEVLSAKAKFLQEAKDDRGQRVSRVSPPREHTSLHRPHGRQCGHRFPRVSILRCGRILLAQLSFR